MKIGYIGLGKMGYNMALRLVEKGHTVVAYNRTPEKIDQLITETQGLVSTITPANTNIIKANNLREVVEKLEGPRVVWVMVPHQVVDDIVNELTEFLQEGDIIIDGGNTYYKDTINRAEQTEQKGIRYIDVGVSGGPNGARNGASLMIGGSKGVFDSFEQQNLWQDLATQNGYAYLGESGAGHFVKMVHNGIEYGMMQAIAEGFDILKNSEFDLNPLQVMKPYENGSVITSSLVSWLSDAFKKYGTNLDPISCIAKHSGEGQWTVETAQEQGIKAKVIEDSLQARMDSETNPNFQAKIVSAMRGEFGGHPVFKEENEEDC